MQGILCPLSFNAFQHSKITSWIREGKKGGTNPFLTAMQLDSLKKLNITQLHKSWLEREIASFPCCDSHRNNCTKFKHDHRKENVLTDRKRPLIIRSEQRKWSSLYVEHLSKFTAGGMTTNCPSSFYLRTVLQIDSWRIITQSQLA